MPVFEAATRPQVYPFSVDAKSPWKQLLFLHNAAEGSALARGQTIYSLMFVNFVRVEGRKQISDGNQRLLDAVAAFEPSVEKLKIEGCHVHKFAASRAIRSCPEDARLNGDLVL